MAQIGKNILVFPQLCHGCGSCTWNCPEAAIQEVSNTIGVLEKGLGLENIEFFQGKLTISEPMPTPIIRQLKKMAPSTPNVIDIFDAPPGASCSVVETLRGVDYVLLVTEPTPFGWHDLKQMFGILHDMNLPGGIIINRDGIGGERWDEALRECPYPTLLRVPFDRKLAAGLASGGTLVEVYPQYQALLQDLYGNITNHLAKTRV